MTTIREDTIAAPATPPGDAGVSIIRISGPEARRIGAAVFSRRLRDHRVLFGEVRDPASGEAFDEAMAILMAAPRSFTREDVVELHLHGGGVTERVLRLVLAQGARAAEPGEFTLRAFLNGRIDLSQAEAVLDLVRARGETAQRVALAGLRGQIGAAVSAIRRDLLHTLAYLVARVDFPEEDVPAEETLPALTEARVALAALLASAASGRLYRDGARVALIGPPNAGKSSLLNRLLREERAIVTPVAGTTRDTLEESVIIEGIPVTLIDTAGFADAPDPIEAIGIERARRAAADADALLLVLDGAAPPPDALDRLQELAGERPLLVALNKSDLPARLAPAVFRATAVPISAHTGDGIAALQAALVELLSGGVLLGQAAVMVANPRHADALRRALASLDETLAGTRAGLPDDFIGIDLRAALDALGEITGETAGEELLDAIFTRFCIGK